LPTSPSPASSLRISWRARSWAKPPLPLSPTASKSLRSSNSQFKSAPMKGTCSRPLLHRGAAVICLKHRTASRVGYSAETSSYSIQAGRSLSGICTHAHGRLPTSSTRWIRMSVPAVSEATIFALSVGAL